MAIPHEFTEEAIAQASVDAFRPYNDFLQSGEPYVSIYLNNQWLTPPKDNEELEWGKGWYYDTTVARKHEYWKDIDLPQPTKDITVMRQNLFDWGYCLIEDGMSQEQCARLRARIEEQAAAERALGIAYLVKSQQHVWSLVNKGDDFVKCLEHHSDGVQAGPIIECLLDETLGIGWNHFSFLSNISYPNCHPQPMHQDQTFIAPYNPREAPVLVNTMYVLQDVNEVNGGTLFIPGSHKPNGTGGPYALYGPMPKPINLEAKAGTILMFDGRLLHGGAVNHSDKFRYVITNSCVKSFIRQQENFLLTMSPEVLAKASDKLLWRLGFQSSITANLVEGYGYQGSGKMGDSNGSVAHVRREMDQGEYRHVGALSPDDVTKISSDEFALARIQKANESFRTPELLEKMRLLS